MLREEAIDLLDNLIGMVEDNHNSDYDKALKMAIKSLEQEPILDKIRAKIEQEYSKFRDMSDIWCERANGLGTALEIIDKYKAESATETWKGYHRNITAPKGTFDKIFNEADEEDDDI